jgi:hypothetical protein
VEALAFLLVVGGVFLVLGMVALKVLLGLVLLPFKIVGWLLKLAIGLVSGVLGLVVAAVSVVGVLLAVVVGLILLPLLPFVILGGLVWMAFRAGRPRTIARVA